MRFVPISKMTVHLIPPPDDFHTKGAGAPIELLDADENADRLWFQQNPFGNSFRKGFQKVQTLFGQFVGNRLSDPVIRQNPVHIIVDGTGKWLHLDHDVKANTLCGPAFGLKRAYLHFDDMVA